MTQRPRPAGGGVGLLAGLAFLGLLPAATAAADLQVACQDRQISIRAQSVPLKQVLTELARRCQMTISLPVQLDHAVSLQMQGVSPERAMQHLLRGHSFILHYANASPDSHNWLQVLPGADTPAGNQDFIRPQFLDPQVDHLEALYQMGEAPGIAGAALLIDALVDPDRDVREAAVASLGELGGEDSVMALAMALDDPDPEVRESAVDALGDIGSDESLAMLEQLLTDTDQVVREAAGDNLDERRRLR